MTVQDEQAPCLTLPVSFLSQLGIVSLGGVLASRTGVTGLHRKERGLNPVTRILPNLHKLTGNRLLTQQLFLRSVSRVRVCQP